MKTILVIDDKDDVRSVIVTTLKDSGFATVEAVDAANGIQLAATRRPDLILCDVNMPDMDGYQTLSAIRELSTSATTPFILMTGNADRNVFRRGMVSGADDFLIKPFTPDELVQAIVSRLVRQMEMEWDASQRAEQVRVDALRKISREIAAPIDGLLGAVTSIMVDYASLNPEAASLNARQINESTARLNLLAQNWAH